MILLCIAYMCVVYKNETGNDYKVCKSLKPKIDFYFTAVAIEIDLHIIFIHNINMNHNITYKILTWLTR